MFTVHHETVPNALSNMFTKRYTISKHVTRQSNHFHIPLVEITQVKNSIYYCRPMLFTKLCTGMELNCSIDSFKTHLKNKISLM